MYKIRKNLSLIQIQKFKFNPTQCVIAQGVLCTPWYSQNLFSIGAQLEVCVLSSHVLRLGEARESVVGPVMGLFQTHHKSTLSEQAICMEQFSMGRTSY